MEMPATDAEVATARAHMMAWIRWHMRTAGITEQQELAARIGVTKGTISQLFHSDTHAPSFRVLLSIAKEVGVTTDVLLGRPPPHGG